MSNLKSLYFDVRSAYSENKRKADHQGAFYVYYFMRPLSFFLTPFFIQLKMSANQATYLGSLAGIVGGVLLYLGGAINLIGASLAILFCEIMDHVDGNLARYYQNSRYYGKFLDSIGGSLAHLSWMLGLSFGLSRWGMNYPLSASVGEVAGQTFLPTISFLLTLLMVFEGYIGIRKDHLQMQASQQGGRPAGWNKAGGWRSIPRKIMRVSSETFAPLFILLPIFNAPDVLFFSILAISILNLPLSIIRTWVKAAEDLDIAK